MRLGTVCFVFGAFALVAASSASAAVSVNIEVIPFGYAPYPAPVVVYQPPYYYAPPPVVYEGRGSWGNDRERHRPKPRGKPQESKHR